MRFQSDMKQKDFQRISYVRSADLYIDRHLHEKISLQLLSDICCLSRFHYAREFKKEATAPVMKQNDNWYNNLVSEYMEDIANYNMKHIEELDYWKDLI